MCKFRDNSEFNHGSSELTDPTGLSTGMLLGNCVHIENGEFVFG